MLVAGVALGSASANAQFTEDAAMCIAPAWSTSAHVEATFSSMSQMTQPALVISDAEHWRRAQDEATSSEDAFASLTALTTRYPTLADRFALVRIERLLAAGPSALTAEDCALDAALGSAHSGVAARARVAQVRCLLAVDDRNAPDALEALLARYRELPQETQLRFEAAQSQERQGHLEQALATYRSLDLMMPGSAEGQASGARLLALATEGHTVRPYTPRERVERATRLVRSAPPELARAAVEALRTETLPAPLTADVLMLASRIARVEGRFDDADALVREARALTPTVADEPTARPPLEEATAALRTLGLGALLTPESTPAVRTRALRRLTTVRLLEGVRVASRVDMSELATLLIDEAARRPSVTCPVRFEMGVLASGAAADVSVAGLLERCSEDAALGIRARYVRARALERAGDLEAARTELAHVREHDDSDTHFYALWANDRLRALDTSDAPEALPETRSNANVAASMQTAQTMLTTLEAEHGRAYPWLARARDLLALGDEDAAREELHDLYIAWLDARGRGPVRAGVEAVYRGAVRERVVVSPTLRRTRRNLAGRDAEELGAVAEALGDVGLAIRFGRSSATERPRAYEALVNASAARYGIDPNLLLAVMRVESVYDAEIVSYAGAIGLLQIMPRTGRLIAHQLGLHDFHTDDLLDPRTNIELAAWYLSSLISRFEGRVPLAIAAYNGGPHNVRRWMEEYGPDMPLDAFLERIPFDQTYRYVRRVLSHYVVYRAQQGLTMTPLEVTLPPRANDVVAF
jgi:soluble lytic murein transglycosylase